MKTIFEVSSKDYEKDKELVKKALTELENLCEVSDSYEFSKPMSRFGWTFFKLWLKPALFQKIDEKFADMIKKAKGNKHDEKLTNFMTDFFSSRGCNVKLKLLETD